LGDTVEQLDHVLEDLDALDRVSGAERDVVHGMSLGKAQAAGLDRTGMSHSTRASSYEATVSQPLTRDGLAAASRRIVLKTTRSGVSRLSGQACCCE
jgi:hypothetical protein